MAADTTLYAAYDDGAIWGIGETPEAALADARNWLDINLTPDERAGCDETQLSIAPCSARLATRLRLTAPTDTAPEWRRSVDGRGDRVLIMPGEDTLDVGAALTDAELVHAVRERCDLSIPKLAAVTGYTERHVSRWLAGTSALRQGTRTLLEAMLAEAPAH